MFKKKKIEDSLSNNETSNARNKLLIEQLGKLDRAIVAILNYSKIWTS